MASLKVYFSDYFDVSAKTLKRHGAFNVSLINDLPVFVDPFLLFNSDKPEYQSLHESIITYLTFLREMSDQGPISRGLLRHWFLFPEVKQNWLGYSKTGNSGSGLGSKFASALNESLATIFKNFGAEQITKGSHLEKLCLVKDGVGKDNISDFTTNLIKGFLCEYTQAFAKESIDRRRTKEVSVKHAQFDYKARRWVSKRYRLPYIDGDYVLLTPRDILTKDEAWINRHDIVGDFEEIIEAIPNDELRGQINDYFLRQIPDRAKKRELDAAAVKTIRKYPDLIDYYIRYKEDRGDRAAAISDDKVTEVEASFIHQVQNFVERLAREGFYEGRADTFDEAYGRVVYLKQVIEANNGYRFFYSKGKPTAVRHVAGLNQPKARSDAGFKAFPEC